MYLIIDENEESSTATELTPAILEALREGVAIVYTVESGDFVWVDEHGIRHPLPVCDWAHDD